MSAICEAFQCTPAEAMKQDPALVAAIFDVRNYRQAIDLHNQGAEGQKELVKHKGLVEIVLEVKRAQEAG